MDASCKRRFLRWSALTVLLATMAGCATPPPPPAKLPEVEVSLPVEREVTDFEDFTGRTDAVATVEMRARVTGYLDKVFFTEGTLVEKGEPLAVIDQRPYEADKAEAQARLDEAQARVRQLAADLDRNRTALARNAMSQQDYDKSLADYQVGKASVAVAQAALDAAKLNLDYTTILAPITGVVGRQLLDPGNTVQANTTPLTTIVSVDPIYAYFDIDERSALRLRRLAEEGKIETAEQAGKPRSSLAAAIGATAHLAPSRQALVWLGLADEDGYSLRGRVNFEDNRIDPSTGTLRVRCVIDNKNRLLSPGMFVRVRFLIGTKYKATLISEKAIGTDQGQKYVYVVKKKLNEKTGKEEDVVEYRRIKTGVLTNGLRVILEDTIKADERVVVAGLQRVRQGTAVAAKLVEMPTGPVASQLPLVTGPEPK